jgi:hypothetical protein
LKSSSITRNITSRQPDSFSLEKNMQTKFYRYSPGRTGDTTVRVGLIFDNTDRHLSTIEKNARELEFALPFPCAKTDPEILECKRREHRGKLMVTLNIRLEADMGWPEARKFLEGAGFQEETS